MIGWLFSDWPNLPQMNRLYIHSCWDFLGPSELTGKPVWGYLSTPWNPNRSNGFLPVSHIIASPICSQLSFQHNWFGCNFSRYVFQSSQLLKRSHVILLRWVRIKSSYRRPFVMSGLHATWCSRHHICNNEMQHSRGIERAAFAMDRALMVSIMSARWKRGLTQFALESLIVWGRLLLDSGGI